MTVVMLRSRRWGADREGRVGLVAAQRVGPGPRPLIVEMFIVLCGGMARYDH